MSDFENRGTSDDTLAYIPLSESDDPESVQDEGSSENHTSEEGSSKYNLDSRLCNEMLWQCGLYSLSGSYVAYYLWKVMDSPSDYLVADWSELHDHYHHLKVLSFIDLRASWCTGVLPSLMWQMISSLETLLYGDWFDPEKIDTNTYLGRCLKAIPVSWPLSQLRDFYTRYHWNRIIENPEQRALSQQNWLSYRRSHFLRIMATLLFSFPVLLCVVFSCSWANFHSNFTTILNDAPPDAPSSFSGWVYRFFPNLSSLKVINNLLPASVCWLSVLVLYSSLKVLDASYFLFHHQFDEPIDISVKNQRRFFPAIEQAASTAIIISLLFFFPLITGVWLCSTSEGGGIEVYLNELIGGDSRHDLLALAFGWISQLPQVNHSNEPTLCFNQSVSFDTSPWTNLTSVCIESFDFSQYVKVTRWEYMYLAAWGEEKISEPWSASFAYRGIDTMGVEQAGVLDVSRDQINIFPFINLGEVTLIEEFGVYPIASILFYFSAALFLYSQASLSWANQTVMPIYQSMVTAIDNYKLVYFVPAFFIMVVCSKCLGNGINHLNSKLSPQAQNFWGVFYNLLDVCDIGYDPDWNNVAGFDAISVDVWFSADLLLVIWLDCKFVFFPILTLFLNHVMQAARGNEEIFSDTLDSSSTLASHTSTDMHVSGVRACLLSDNETKHDHDVEAGRSRLSSLRSE
ncbi:MAG: hypothetical protein CL816_06255 [Coxiellaceae bacterium]|nr:hypothetical protein [Coxiellaceae bacterium]|tara:strand:- start:8035 stop:10089 length:2055 start_codon:yes stop_codon:yes gene_type:complete